MAAQAAAPWLNLRAQRDRGVAAVFGFGLLRVNPNPCRLNPPGCPPPSLAFPCPMVVAVAVVVVASSSWKQVRSCVCPDVGCHGTSESSPRDVLHGILPPDEHESCHPSIRPSIARLGRGRRTYVCGQTYAWGMRLSSCIHAVSHAIPPHIACLHLGHPPPHSAKWHNYHHHHHHHHHNHLQLPLVEASASPMLPSPAPLSRPVPLPCSGLTCPAFPPPVCPKENHRDDGRRTPLALHSHHLPRMPPHLTAPSL
jgi:hypothetical protein